MPVRGGGGGCISPQGTAIRTEEDLKQVQVNNEQVRYYLSNDITLAGEWKPLGARTTPQLSNPFKGHFNGCGYTIRGLTISSSANYNNLGLFYSIQDAFISHLHIEGNITNDNAENVGLLAGETLSALIDNCSSKGNITVGKDGSSVGGLVGWHIAHIETSFSEAVVKAVKGSDGGNAGGLVGKLESTIINSYATGNVEAKASAGGLVGIATGGEILHSYAKGDVLSIYGDAGGVVGTFMVTTSGKLDSSVAANDIVKTTNGSNVGRVVGDKGTGTLVNNSGKNGMTLMVGNTVVSANERTDSGKDGADADVSSQAAYQGWNFNTVWKWDSAKGRPVLK